MMGDREKCIQAQMDEYLSKPLQQNHLIQTILKCATLGGQLLEKNRERELSRTDTAVSARRDVASPTSSYESSQTSLLRPPLTNRAITAGEGLGAGLDSPSLITADQEDPLSRARTSLSAPNIHERN